jgi:hypothetical protein
MTALGLTRAGRIAFTSVALLGLALALADALIPRPQPESDIGPNVGGVVVVFTIGILALVAAADAVIRVLRRAADHFANPSS